MEWHLGCSLRDQPRCHSGLPFNLTRHAPLTKSKKTANGYGRIGGEANGLSRVTAGYHEAERASIALHPLPLPQVGPHQAQFIVGVALSQQF